MKRNSASILLICFALLFSACGPTSQESSQEMLDPQVTETPEEIVEKPTAEVPTNTPTAMVLPTPTLEESILFRDYFSGSSTQYDEEDEYGTVKQVQGKLVINASMEDSLKIFTVPGSYLNNVVIDFHVYASEGEVDDGYGLFCRSSDTAGYMFYITFDGYFLVSLWESSRGYTDLSEYQFSPAIKTGMYETNYITIVCHQDQLALMVNDVLLVSVKDAQLTRGDIALFAANDSVSNAKVHFDNLVVTKSKESLDVLDQVNQSPSSSCLSPGSITKDDEGKLVEICGEVTNWGEVPCPSCPLGSYSFITLDKTFSIISYEWVFNFGWVGDCIRVSDTVELLGSDPVFTFGHKEGFAGSDCSVDSDGVRTCLSGDYFNNSTICD